MSLEGRRAFVTGATSGIGAATARALRAAGARVVGVGRAECDVRDERQVQAAVSRAAAELGGLDVVVTSAGVGRFAPFGELSVADLDDALATNVRGTFLVFRAALPHVIASRGHLFALSSVSAVRPIAYNAAYGASKAAVRMLAQVLAEEVRGSGVRVTTLVVGAVDTPFWDRAGGTELPKEKMLRPEDVAREIVAAASAPARENVEEIVIMPSDGVLRGGTE